MDEMTAFEQQIAREVMTEAGPEPRFNATTVSRSVTSRSSRSRFRSVLSAARFVTAALVVVLFAGILLTGTLAPQREETTTGLLSGVELSVKEVRPGVYRILGDGIRDLGNRLGDLVVTSDGSVWIERRTEPSRESGSVFIDVIELGQPAAAVTNEGDELEVKFDVRSDGTALLFRRQPHGVSVFSFDGDGWVPQTGAEIAACTGRSMRDDKLGLRGLLASDDSCWLGTWSAKQLPSTSGAVAATRVTSSGRTQVFTFEDLGQGPGSFLSEDDYGLGLAWTEADDGTIWATYDRRPDRGLMSFDGQDWTYVPYGDDAGNAGVNVDGSSLAITPDGVVWTATARGGVDIRGWDGARWTAPRTGHGVSCCIDFPYGSPQVNGLSVDPGGQLWHAGFERVDETSSAVIRGLEEFDRGVPYIEAVSFAPNGVIWLIGPDGLYAIRPEIALPAIE
jgi:hypothetical protein